MLRCYREVRTLRRREEEAHRLASS
jgi:hypothetical protein